MHYSVLAIVIKVINQFHALFEKCTFTISALFSSSFGRALWSDLGAWRHVPQLSMLFRHGQFWVIGTNRELLTSTLSWLVSCSSRAMWMNPCLCSNIISLNDLYEPGSFSRAQSLQTYIDTSTPCHPSQSLSSFQRLGDSTTCWWEVLQSDKVFGYSGNFLGSIQLAGTEQQFELL